MARLNNPDLAPSPRQREILALLAEGHTTPEIARKLFVSPDTVKQHLGDLYSRLGARNRTHCVHLAWVTGLIRPSAELAAAA